MTCSRHRAGRYRLSNPGPLALQSCIINITTPLHFPLANHINQVISNSANPLQVYHQSSLLAMGLCYIDLCSVLLNPGLIMYHIHSRIHWQQILVSIIFPLRHAHCTMNHNTCTLKKKHVAVLRLNMITYNTSPTYTF